MNLKDITSVHNLKGLRQLYDHVESHVRSLYTLGLQSSIYNGLLASTLLSKLPSDVFDINILISADFYWTLTTGTRLEGKLDVSQLRPNWVLSGPVPGYDCGDSMINLISSHVLTLEASKRQHRDKSGQATSLVLGYGNAGNQGI